MIDKKKLILEKAYKLFLKFGYKKTTVNDIADYIGIGKGSIYYYFKSKEDIFLELLLQENECIHKKLISRLTDESNVVNKIVILGTGFYDLVKDEGLLMQQLFFGENDALLAKIKDYKCHREDEIKEILYGLLDELNEAYVLDKSYELDVLKKVLFKRVFHVSDSEIPIVNDYDEFETLLMEFKKENKVLLEIIFNGFIIKERK